MIYDNKLEVKEMVGCILVREDIWWPWPVELPLASLVQISHYPFYGHDLQQDSSFLCYLAAISSKIALYPRRASINLPLVQTLFAFQRCQHELGIFGLFRRYWITTGRFLLDHQITLFAYLSSYLQRRFFILIILAGIRAVTCFSFSIQFVAHTSSFLLDNIAFKLSQWIFHELVKPT